MSSTCRLKVLQEYCVAVMEIETLKDAVSTDRVENNPHPLSVSEREVGSCGSSNQLQHGMTGERKVAKAYENSNDENGPQSSNDDGNETGDDVDDELEENDDDNKSGLDEIDAYGGDNNSSDSDEDEDGGFAFATEGYLDLDDPMENALDTLLNVELEINRNAKKPRKR